MTNKEWALAEITRDTENKKELLMLRAEAMERHDMRMYSFYQSGIRELNQEIRALREAYGIGENKYKDICVNVACGDMEECYSGRCSECSNQ